MTLPYLFSGALLSPLPFVLLATWGLIRVWRGGRGRRGGMALAGGSLSALLVCCMPAFGNVLLGLLEPPALSAEQVPMPVTLARGDGITPVAPGGSVGGDALVQHAQAIVILSAGRNRMAPEWEGETVDANTAARTRYGAVLARRTALPVLVSGGSPGTTTNGAPMQPLATLMARMLSDEFGMVPRWMEHESLTTVQNAIFSAALLHPAGIRRVLLVTSAVHMPRAMRAFRAAGFEPVAAPTDYMGQQRFLWRDLLPTVEGLRRSHFAAREALANLWYVLGRGA